LWYNVYTLAVRREEIVMAKTAVISARIDPELKRNAEQVFGELGLTASQAIMLFYKQVDLQRGLPFSVKIPNEVTKQALEDARARRNLESFDSIEDLYEDLGI
jgi:DNA-damage-inducible protein J